MVAGGRVDALDCADDLGGEPDRERGDEPERPQVTGRHLEELRRGEGPRDPGEVERDEREREDRGADLAGEPGGERREGEAVDAAVASAA